MSIVLTFLLKKHAMLVYAEVNYIFWAISLHTDIHWSVVQCCWSGPLAVNTGHCDKCRWACL